MASNESSSAVNRPLSLSLRPFILCCFLLLLCCYTVSGDGSAGAPGSMVRRDERTRIAVTEYGEVSAVDVGNGRRGFYHLQFITLEPNALFLPVLLHADMVLYVRTGSGRLTWVDEDDARRVNLRRGDIYRLPPGTIFHVQSDLDPQREKLRIHAFFTNPDDDSYEPLIGAYSSVGDLLRGFDRKVLQEAFKAPEELIEEILSATRPPPIIHATAASESKKHIFWEWEARMLKSYLTGAGSIGYNKKKTRAYNVYDADKDFENCNGWSLTVTKKDARSLKHANIGIFLVNLTRGSMMGPHWNPQATEVAIVLHGQGMIRLVCSSSSKESDCKSTRFRVNEGDVFMVRRFYPMAQMSYNNDSFVFMGFSTTTRRNYPQFLAGKSSVLQALGKDVLAASFNVPNTTVDELMAPQADSVILECTSCAEEEERLMEEEIEKEREEEAERRREEEEREREEEEEKRRREEEEREREEEKERQREEEEREREEEKARQREEEERRREEEEERRREEEEEEARRKEEEEKRRREEEEREREKEKEERRREEEEGRRRREEEEEREWEEEERRWREQEEEGQGRREQEEEHRSRRRQEYEREREMRQHEEDRRRRRERAEREQEEARRQEEEMERWQREGEEAVGGG
ncbi:vicilin-like seed storage protein At2g18540 [Punica granatum]|uniref:Vicilin-like seed storage protein At2g18540 n=1 Tax=Punica granatum TaxID=22663 RepID=A0A6P8CTV7_PUNGR|nr:vicilin-like seed storage protein At2g18540 [Punica granatum]